MKEYDVIIAGGGTAGAIAAISAARMGLRTLVVEKLAGLGGSQTYALVTPYMSMGIEGEEFVNSAIGNESTARLVSMGHAIWCRHDRFDPEALKTVLEDMVLEAGAEILYDTAVIEARAEGRKIREVDIFNADGISTLQAKEFIDCTGDAQLSKLLHVAMESGNEEGVNQSASLRFELGNVDVQKISDFLEAGGQSQAETGLERVSFCVQNRNQAGNLVKIFTDGHERGELSDIEFSHIQFFSIPGCPGKISMNCPETGSGKGISSAEEKTRRIIQGRKSILHITEFLRKHVPGFENCYVSQVSAILGIRESERIHAEYDFTYEDAKNRRSFPDAILRTNYQIDVHDGGNVKKRTDHVNGERPVENGYMEMPYRSIVPKEYDNLLVAGRCAGMDFLTQSSIRVQKTCQAMGEAAGIAAALAIREGKACREVDGVRVREIMRERGSML